MSNTPTTFRVTYAPDLQRYVVVRGELRVVPSVTPRDADGAQRARELCEALNVVYATEPTT